MNSSLPRLTKLSALIAAVSFVVRPDAGAGAEEPAAAATDPYVETSAGETPAKGRDGDTPAGGGDRLLRQAAVMLERRESISARLRHQVFLGGNPMFGIGSYWQQASGADLRVRLELQIAGQDASLLQVSNSRFLWIDRRLPTGRCVSRVDLRKLRADPTLSATTLDELAPGSATWASLQPDLIAHSGGLPSIIASLAENFSYLPPQAMRLVPQAAGNVESASVPVFVVVGHWKHEKLLPMLGDGQKTGVESQEPNSRDAYLSALHAIPSRLPQEVLLLVGQADLFPYRIEYRRLETPIGTGSETPSIPYQLSPNPLAVLELTDVMFDVPIAAGQFDYAPGDADWVDQTATVLERLLRGRQEQLAVRAQGDQQSLPVR